jgi:N-acetylneuraminic acid mutarotase
VYAVGTRARSRLLSAALDEPLVGHTVTAISDNMIIVAGGWDGSDINSPTDKIYWINPATGNVNVVANLREPAFGHTATLLNDGRILFAGGKNKDSGVLSGGAIFDPGSFSVTRITLQGPRSNHTAVKTNDGKVYFIGGTSDGADELNSVEVFSP